MNLYLPTVKQVKKVRVGSKCGGCIVRRRRRPSEC